MQTQRQAKLHEAQNGDQQAATMPERSVASETGAVVVTNGDARTPKVADALPLPVPLPSKESVRSAALSVSSLVLYLLSSSLIIILNKRLMVDDGFKYPMALTGMAQLAGALAGAWHHPAQQACCGQTLPCMAVAEKFHLEGTSCLLVVQAVRCVRWQYVPDFVGLYFLFLSRQDIHNEMMGST